MRIRTSSAAEFQSIQTRAKMGAALWSQTLGSVFLLWLALTLWLVWHRVGQDHPELQHAYFFRWIFCGILTDTPVLGGFTTGLPMCVNGAWYHLTDFIVWLDQLYGA